MTMSSRASHTVTAGSRFGRISKALGNRPWAMGAKIGPEKDIPHLSASVIVKYITDLELLGLL